MCVCVRVWWVESQAESEIIVDKFSGISAHMRGIPLLRSFEI